MGICSYTGVQRPGWGVDHSPPSSAEVKERVELYLYSPLWAFMACSRVNFTFTCFSYFRLGGIYVNPPLPEERKMFRVHQRCENMVSVYCIQVKVKVTPRHVCAGTEGRRRCSSSTFATSALKGSEW
jgi:hypothetical protein